MVPPRAPRHNSENAHSGCDFAYGSFDRFVRWPPRAAIPVRIPVPVRVPVHDPSAPAARGGACERENVNVNGHANESKSLSGIGIAIAFDSAPDPDPDPDFDPDSDFDFDTIATGIRGYS